MYFVKKCLYSTDLVVLTNWSFANFFYAMSVVVFEMFIRFNTQGPCVCYFLFWPLPCSNLIVSQAVFILFFYCPSLSPDFNVCFSVVFILAVHFRFCLLFALFSCVYYSISDCKMYFATIFITVF